MEYISPFNLKDKVYNIHQASRPVWTPCKMCLGKGTIELNGETEDCPKCYSRGGDEVWEPTEWRIMIECRDGWPRTIVGSPVRLTIGLIRLEHMKGRSPEWWCMCAETGVGSGSNYKMDNLFKTIEEAQAECDRRNHGTPTT